MSVRVEDGRIVAAGDFRGDDETHERLVVERIVPGPAAPAARIDPADNDGPLVVRYNTGQGQMGITVEEAGDGTDYFNVDQDGDVNISKQLVVADVDAQDVVVANELTVQDLQNNDAKVVPDKEDECPDVAGTVANNGCPEPTAEVVNELNEYSNTILLWLIPLILFVFGGILIIKKLSIKSLKKK